MKKQVLVIGAAGFIGKELLKELKGYDVTCFIRKGEAINFKTKIFYGDITKREDVIKASEGKDAIINLATPNTQIYEINYNVLVNGAKNIVEAAKKNKVKRVIAISSFAAYRKNLDNYGRAKKEADKVMLKSNINVVILRLTMVYGKGGYAFEKLASSVKKIPFLVFVVGDGKYRIQPAYVKDVVYAIKKAIEIKNKKITMFDVGGPKPIEYNQFVKKVLKILNKKKIIVHLPVKLVIAIVKFLNIFVKDVAWNKITIKRMVENIVINTKKTERVLNIKLIDYDKALKEVL